MRMNCRVLVAGLLLGLSMVSLGAAAQTRSGSRSGHDGVVNSFRTGQKVPDSMLTDENIVKSYSHYHLRKPPDGYQWVHAGDTDILLVSVKSHIVSKIQSRPNIRPETK
jgi:Ni/Co efflux regulator RcnB